MSMSSAIAAGRAYVELLLKDESFQAKLKKSSETMKNWGKGLRTAGMGVMAVGAGMLAPFAAAIPMFAAGAARLDDLAQRLSAPVEEMQRLAYAGEMAGVNIEEMTPGLVDFEKNLAKSGRSGKDLVGQLMLVADELKAIEDPAKKMELLSKYFGGGAAAMMPLLSGGSAGLGASMGQADSLGLVVKQEDIAAAAALDDAWTELKMTALAFDNTLAVAVIPYLTPLIEYAVQTVAAFTKWIDENRGVATALAAVGVGVLAVGAALTGLGTIFTIVGSAIAGFTTLLTLLAAPAAPVILAILAIVAAVGALIAGVTWLMGAWGGATKATDKQAESLKKLREQQAKARADKAAAANAPAPRVDKAFGQIKEILRPAVGFSGAGAANRFGVGINTSDKSQQQINKLEKMLETLRSIDRKTKDKKFGP